jgi:hypothetical protein
LPRGLSARAFGDLQVGVMVDLDLDLRLLARDSPTIRPRFSDEPPGL